MYTSHTLRMLFLTVFVFNNFFRSSWNFVGLSGLANNVQQLALGNNDSL